MCTGWRNAWNESWGDERQGNLFDGSERDWEEQPSPDGPITVGLDGGYMRAAHKQGWFEIIAGKSVVVFRRANKNRNLRFSGIPK